MPWPGVSGAMAKPCSKIIVLERVFEPVRLRQRGGEMHAEFEERVAERHADAVLGCEPCRPQHVGEPAMHVKDVDRPRRDQPPLAGEIEIFAGVEMGERDRLGDLPQPLEVVAQARVLDPEHVVAGVTERMEAADRLFLGSMPRWRRP